MYTKTDLDPILFIFYYEYIVRYANCKLLDGKSNCNKIQIIQNETFRPLNLFTYLIKSNAHNINKYIYIYININKYKYIYIHT